MSVYKILLGPLWVLKAVIVCANTNKRETHVVEGRFEELSRHIKYLTLKSVDRGPGQSSQNVKVRLIIGRMLKVGFYINVALIYVGGRLAGLDTNSILLCFFFVKNH